jgi:tetratricopeptide (TPR) repeat protein
MRARPVVVAAGILLVALLPSTALAQMETFARAVRELADANTQHEPGRSEAIRAAADRMGATLAEWDRDIKATEAKAAAELVGATPLRKWQLHVELGVAYRARGRFDDALREFDVAAALRPTASDLQVLRGLTLESAGRTSEAGQAFRSAFAVDARNPVKAYYVVRRLGPSADRDRAYQLLNDTYRGFPIDARPSAPPFLTLDAIPDTLSPAVVVGDETTADAFRLIVDARYADAIAALHRADRPKAADDSPQAHFARGQSAEANTRVADARREYQAALPGTLTGRRLMYVGLARLAQVEGDADDAIEAFLHAALIAPNDVGVHKELATAYVAHDLVDDAFSELIAALLIDPRDAQAHAAIGQLYLDGGHNEEAVTAFTRALTLAPDHYETRYALSTAFRRLGRTEEAEAELGTFERVRRRALEQRRRDIAVDVEKEEAVHRGTSQQDSSR